MHGIGKVTTRTVTTEELNDCNSRLTSFNLMPLSFGFVFLMTVSFHPPICSYNSLLDKSLVHDAIHLI